jgi:protein TonB
MLDYNDTKIGLDEIVFENRNHAYGAYDLRKRYEERVRAAIFWASSGLLALVLIPVALQQVRSGDKKEMTVVIDLKNPRPDMPAPPKREEPRPEPKPAAPARPKPAEATKKYNDLKVVDDSQADIVPIQDSLEGKVLGSEDVVTGKPAGGNSPTLTTAPGGDGPGGAGKEPGGLVEENVVRDFVQDMPRSPYSYAKYLRDHIHYPAPAIAAEVSGRVTVQFIVQPDGAITNVSVLKGLGFGCDEEAMRIISQMPAWVPGRQNGVAVPVRIAVPIVFKLE